MPEGFIRERNRARFTFRRLTEQKTIDQIFPPGSSLLSIEPPKSCAIQFSFTSYSTSSIPIHVDRFTCSSFCLYTTSSAILNSLVLFFIFFSSLVFSRRRNSRLQSQAQTQSSHSSIPTHTLASAHVLLLPRMRILFLLFRIGDSFGKRWLLMVRKILLGGCFNFGC